MTSGKSEVRKMVAELRELRIKSKTVASKAMKNLESQMGLDFMVETRTEYDDNDYYKEVRLESVGDVGFSIGINDFENETDISEVLNPILKELKKDLSKREALESPLNEIQVGILDLCIQTKKSPEEVLGIIVDYLMICELEPV